MGHFVPRQPASKPQRRGRSARYNGRMASVFPSRPTLSAHPLSRLVWSEPTLLNPNGYNPNKIFTPELGFLKMNLLSFGWLAPVFVRVPDHKPLPLTPAEAYEQAAAELLPPELAAQLVARAAQLLHYDTPGIIVDGFHRWGLGMHDPDVRALSHQRVPAVYAHLDDFESMQATLACNKARGQHGIVKSAAIVQRFIGSGFSVDDTAFRLSMEREEVIRLGYQKPSPERNGQDFYGRAWVPDNPTGSSRRGKRSPAR